MTGIYSILNTANGKRYVGQSTHLSKRRWIHFHDLRLNRHKNAHLQAAYSHYGPSAFRWEVLEVVAAVGGCCLVAGQASLDASERRWIALYASNDPKHGYNVELGGLTRPRASGTTRLRMQKAQGLCRNRLKRDSRDMRDVRDSPS